ncbi:MAG TPA: phasin family protein [Nevskiaceae bacterium]|nr:phasin family protein [Nevskiaceae bacterium]
MNVETLVADVKTRVEPIVAKGQEIATVSLDALKQTTTVLVDGVQTVVKTQIDAGKDLFAAVQTSFEKAKTDGLKAVAAAPIEYLPAGRERVISAYNDTVATVTKTGEQVVQVVRKGFEEVSAKFTGVTVEVVPAAAPAKKTAKKASAKKAA